MKSPAGSGSWANPLTRHTILFILALYVGFPGLAKAQEKRPDIFAVFPAATTNAVVTNYVALPATPTPPSRTLPEDVVQESIELIRMAENNFAVRWTFTEAGAKKVLAVWDAAQPSDLMARFRTPAWKAGWLKHWTTKAFFHTEEAAKAHMASLKQK